jgi:pyruvate/2-oxoglutarate dehydrogenase complex dihydrolipoamide dehydrogenase (E3) component
MEGMALAKTLFLDGGKPTVPDYNAVPSAVFSHPMLAYVVRDCSRAVQQLAAPVMVMAASMMHTCSKAVHAWLADVTAFCCTASLLLNMPGCSNACGNSHDVELR